MLRVANFAVRVVAVVFVGVATLAARAVGAAEDPAFYRAGRSNHRRLQLCRMPCQV